MKIQALDYSLNLLRAMLWQYNDAARLEGLLRAKQAWYDQNQTEFWEAWVRDVFDLDATVITDPVSGTPLVLPRGRHRVLPGAGSAGAAAPPVRAAATAPIGESR